MKKFFITLLKILLAVVILLVAICIYEIYISNYQLTVSRYEIRSSKITTPIRVVQLTDLHNSVFGKDNSKLVTEVKALDPDVIFITGDLINMDNDDLSIGLNLLTKLSEITDVYVSYGNHEAGYEEAHNTDLRTVYESCGVTVVEKDWIDLEINNNPIRLGGIYGYCLPEEYSDSGDRKIEADYVKAFQDTDRYKILLCHMPFCWARTKSLDSYDVDCVFAGHVHGGHIILPFKGPLYAPDFGYFPGRMEGLFYSKDQTKVMVLSRGLGHNEKIPRMFNIPEILLCEINPE